MNNFAKTKNYSLVCALVALGAVGCTSNTGTGSSGETSSGSGSGSGSSSGSPPGGVVLMPNPTGFVEDATSGVKGAWYVYSDGFGADGMPASGDCVSKGMFMPAQCSQVTSPPAPYAPFAPSANGMCIKGIAAMVLNNTANPMGDYSDIFGEGIGLDLNNPGGDAGSVKGTFDGSKYTGISFTIDKLQASLRVQFPTMEASSNDAYWDGAANFGSPVMPGVNTFKWAEVGGPKYLTGTPPAFDNTKLFSIQFAVYTSTGATVPVDFCISNLTLTTG